MEYFELHPETPQQRYINKAVETLKSGGIVIYPTDTVYGLGCDIFNKAALDRIFNIKGEPYSKLLSFVCANLKDIARYAKVSDYAYRTMKKALPGPYTFLLPAARDVPKKLWSQRKTVGIRIPNNKVALALVQELGNPIISTSVTNRSGEVLTDPLEIKTIFNPLVEMMLSIGPLDGGVSTIIDLSEDIPSVVREGAGDIAVLS